MLTTKIKLKLSNNQFFYEWRNNKLNLLEFLTLATLVALTFWAVRPLLEEWGIFHGFNKNGLGSALPFGSERLMRPFHLMPFAFQWLLGGGQPIGVAIVTSILLVTRYVVARWAISPFLKGYDRWVVATLAAVLVSWPGAWLGRYAAAQMSVIFYFLALGFIVRLYQRWSVTCACSCAASVLLMLMTYQALALCILAIPIASLLWGDIRGHQNGKRYLVISCLVRLYFPIITGFAIYGAYTFTIVKLMGRRVYEGQLAQSSSGLLSYTGLVSHIKASYITTFIDNGLLLPFLLLIVFLLHLKYVREIAKNKSQMISWIVASMSVAMLPILSLSYVSGLHIRDIDRVLFPVSVGFVLVCLSIIVHYRDVNHVESTNVFGTLVIISLLIASLFNATNIRNYWKIQEDIIYKTLASIEGNNIPRLVIRDTSGVLGDVYTLLGTTLTEAIAVYGKDCNVTICTPMSVDRIHPVGRRYPISTTPRCEDLSIPPTTTLVLTVRQENEGFLLSSEGL